MAENRPPVAVVDDDPAVLRSVSRLLTLNGFEALAYSSAETLLAELDDLCPTCIVADLAMPDMSGLELQRRLAEGDSNYPIVFITGRGDIRSSVRAMRGGAIDFLAKPFEREELLAAIRRAQASSAANRELREQLAAIRLRLDSLTPREREVFRYVVEGYLNKQIASELEITEKTVKVHRARVMQKMGVRSVAKLARLAERLGEAEAA